MFYRNIKLCLISILLTLNLFAFIPGEEKVKELLGDVDKWITTDTTRMMNYINTENKKTMERLQSSKFWEPTERDLSFLLSIDYVTSSQIDNTGRIYYRMRLTGETDALFFTDSPIISNSLSVARIVFLSTLKLSNSIFST